MPLRLLFVLALCLLSTACREIPPEAEGTNIFPLFRYASYKDSDDYELDILWPLFHKSLVRDRSTFRLILFQNEELPPVLSRTFLFPIFAATRTPVRNDLTLVPLFGWEDEGNKSTFKVIPFWLDTVAAVKTTDGDVSGVRLLFEEAEWEKDGTRVKLLDLLGLAHLYDLDTTRVGFPDGPDSVQPGFTMSFVKILELVELFGWSTAGAYSDVRVVQVMGSETFSLFRSQRRMEVSPNAGEGETHLFPFFYSGRDSSSSYVHLWPLFGTKTEGENYHRYYFFYPVFAIGSDPVADTSDMDVVWPLVDYDRVQDAKTLKLLFIPIRWGGQTPPATSPPPETPPPQPAGT